MPNDDPKRLLNDIDLKEIYERHSDVRTCETLAVSIMAVFASLAALAVLNAGIVGEGGKSLGLILILLGSVLAWLGRLLRLRLVWLRERSDEAMQRLARRNELPAEYAGLAFHQAFDRAGIVGAVQSERLRARLRFTSPLSAVGALEPLGRSAALFGITILVLNIVY
jgi:hypothetical protein